jgi:type II restriction enzyme
MNLQMAQDAAIGYKSGCQITRRVTEAWGENNLYCAACFATSVCRAPANTKAIDFHCNECGAPYQLKAGRRWNERKVPDAGYAAMMAAIRSDYVPNLLVLHYTDAWDVKNLILIPSFVFSASAIEKRKPLASTARRAGWVGCNILLAAMPDSGKIRIVCDGAIANPDSVRATYRQLKPLAEVPPEMRGWTLDVLRIVQGLSRREFTLDDVYAFAHRLQVLHPKNRHVRPKIRQQLQVLRDFGLLTFEGGGRYRLNT